MCGFMLKSAVLNVKLTLTKKKGMVSFFLYQLIILNRCSRRSAPLAPKRISERAKLYKTKLETSPARAPQGKTLSHTNTFLQRYLVFSKAILKVSHARIYGAVQFFLSFVVELQKR